MKKYTPRPDHNDCEKCRFCNSDDRCESKNIHAVFGFGGSIDYSRDTSNCHGFESGKHPSVEED